MRIGKKFIWIGVILSLIATAAGAGWWYLNNLKTPILSPLISSDLWPFASKRQIKVTSFLPYWNLKDDYQIDWNAFDTLIYFDLLVDQDGYIIHRENGEMEPGWRNFQSDKVQKVLTMAKKRGKKVGISIAAFDDEVLTGVPADVGKQQTLIGEIMGLMAEYGFNHINIDFEYFPKTEDKEFGQNFNIFLDNLRRAIKQKNDNIVLSVDIYPKAVIRNTPYKVREMSAIADQTILMAYDFFNILSENSGPVAPLKTNNEKEYSITQTLQAYIGKIEMNKLTLGIPLYGYEWQTVDDQPRSSTVPRTGQTASYRRVKELIADKDLTVNWDATASSPWLWYETDGELHQIYFENMESLKLKIQLAEQLHLGGIAFWALGYEGNNKEIWDYVKKLE